MKKYYFHIPLKAALSLLFCAEYSFFRLQENGPEGPIMVLKRLFSATSRLKGMRKGGFPLLALIRLCDNGWLFSAKRTIKERVDARTFRFSSMQPQILRLAALAQEDKCLNHRELNDTRK